MKRLPDFFKRGRTDKQLCGQAAEEEALAYLVQQGLILVERNFRCKGGEIDLVMRDPVMRDSAMRQHETLVFVEVRKRADGRHGGAAASVTQAKQARLIVAAQRFLQRYRMPPACRFDVIAIDGTQMTWLKNAIEA
jgi:putative endonuclease